MALTCGIMHYLVKHCYGCVALGGAVEELHCIAIDVSWILVLRWCRAIWCNFLMIVKWCYIITLYL